MSALDINRSKTDFKVVTTKLLTWSLIVVFLYLAITAVMQESHGHGAHEQLNEWLLFILILVVPGKIAEALMQRAGLPGVLGALAMGVVIRALLGNELADDILQSPMIIVIKDWGTLQLLFNTGLESNLLKMIEVGVVALVVAIVGVTVPFISGWLWIGPWLWPDAPGITHVMVGACLVATSVGITASILKELGLQDTPVGRILIAAAVFDDVFGVLFLVGTSASAAGESMGFGEIVVLVLKSFGFLGGAIAIGYVAAPHLSKLFSKVHPGNGMRTALGFGLYILFGWLAGKQGMEPLLGSFSAGLVLDRVHFSHFHPSLGRSRLMSLLVGVKDTHRDEAEKAIEETEHHEVEELFLSLSQIVITVFFVYTGMQLRLDLVTPAVLMKGIVVSLVAALGKEVAGFVVPGSMWKKILVGLGMIARGEVGLIFAAAALAAGAFNQEQFATVLVVVVITTLIPALSFKAVAMKLPAHETVSEQTSSH